MFKIDIENTSDLNAAIPPLKEATENKDSKEEASEAEVKTKEPEQGSQGLESEDDKTNIPADVSEKEEKPTKTSTPDKDKEKYWSKLKKEREEKAAMAERLEQLQQEKLQMEQMLRQAINTGSTHYKNNVAGELEMAQARLQLALESGDAAGVSRATAEISKATHALNEASRIASFPKEEYSEEHLNQVRAREYEDRLYSWLESNPEVDRNAPEYDEKLAGQVLSFIRKLDRKYQTTNKEHLIGGGGYYSMIDEYIDNLKAQDTTTTPAKHFGAVRSRAPMEGVPDPKTRELSDREKKAALAFGMSYERYRELLDKHNKEMRSKNGN
ncbi:hypothetical protein MPCS_01970 (plasmid) [Candidatus Megaera polyxenophila]|nr:hypothetical protein MPCS_01970 [Candidatus Megaera polyxenophila]